jgi:hypothetical protein
MGNNKENCDEIILGIREKITRFVLTKIDQELNKLQELSVNCQQQQNINSPNGNNNQWGSPTIFTLIGGACVPSVITFGTPRLPSIT